MGQKVNPEGLRMNILNEKTNYNTLIFNLI